MGATDLDEFGPVDFAVIEFPEGSASATHHRHSVARADPDVGSATCSRASSARSESGTAAGGGLGQEVYASGVIGESTTGVLPGVVRSASSVRSSALGVVPNRACPSTATSGRWQGDLRRALWDARSVRICASSTSAERPSVRIQQFAVARARRRRPTRLPSGGAIAGGGVPGWRGPSRQ